MKFVRAIPQLGALPELLAFYCSRCKQADTKMQDDLPRQARWLHASFASLVASEKEKARRHRLRDHL